MATPASSTTWPPTVSGLRGRRPGLGEPLVVRGLEIRGSAEALSGQTPPNGYWSAEVIRIHPRRIITWGVGPEGMRASRAVPAD